MNRNALGADWTVIRLILIDLRNILDPQVFLDEYLSLTVLSTRFDGFVFEHFLPPKIKITNFPINKIYQNPFKWKSVIFIMGGQNLLLRTV